MTEDTHSSTDASSSISDRLVRALPIRGAALAFVTLVLFVGPAAAQSAGSAFCGTDMAQTIQNIFTLIQFGGPLVGGVLALGATVALPFVRRSDWKKEMKSIRNQGLLWGVIVAPLGTQIVAFLLNNVVAGGSSCGF
jgi:type IV secretory pathway VirB2 component (pilin)